MLKILAISLFIVLSSPISSVRAGFKPKEVPPPKTTAQGTRGCPISMGELALFGTEGGERLTVKINIDRPLLLYQVVSDKPEKLLLTVTEVRGKLERTQVYRRELGIVDGDYSTVPLPGLDPDRDYLLTLVLLCQDRPQYGKAIHAWMNFVRRPTEVDTFVQTRNLLDETQTDQP